MQLVATDWVITPTATALALARLATTALQVFISLFSRAFHLLVDTGSTSPTQIVCPSGTYYKSAGLSSAVCSGLCNAGRWGSPAQTTAQCSGACIAGQLLVVLFCDLSTFLVHCRTLRHTWTDQRSVHWPVQSWLLLPSRSAPQPLLHCFTSCVALIRIYIANANHLSCQSHFACWQCLCE